MLPRPSQDLRSCPAWAIVAALMEDAIDAPTLQEADSSNRREIAKALYMQGVPRAEIAARVPCTLSCLDSWRKRGDWKTTRQGIASAVMVLQSPPKPESFTLRPMLQDVLKALIPSCPTKMPKGSREQKATADTVLSLAQASKLVEGWSDTNIAVLDVDMLSRDHREVVVQPAQPVAELPADHQQATESKDIPAESQGS